MLPRNIYDLKLIAFVEAICYNDTTLLCNGYKASEEEITSKMSQYVSEYDALINGNAFNNKKNEIERLEALELKISLAESILVLCNQGINNEHLFSMFYKFKYPLPDVAYTTENFNKVKYLFEGEVRAQSLTVRVKKDELSKIIQVSEEKVQRKVFDEMLLAININLKLSLNINDISVSTFCIAYNAYKEHVKELTKTLNK